MSTKQDDFVGPVIPLALRFKMQIRTTNNWGELLELAQSDLSVGQKLGFLHDIFNVELGREPEYDSSRGGWVPYPETLRLKFLFEVADGWADRDSLETPGHWRDNPEPTLFFGSGRDGLPRRLRESELRQMIAKKAFDMLVPALFAMPEVKEERDQERKKDREEKWLNDFVSGSVCQLVQQFFRLEKARYGDGLQLRNLPPRYEWSEMGQSEKVARGFLLKLPRALWEWKRPEIAPPYGDDPKRLEEYQKKLDAVEAMRARVNETKVWMIDALTCLGELPMLSRWILQLDRRCLAKLKEIAMRNTLSAREYPVFDDRLVETLDEACLLGSPSAWLLKRRELMRRERAKLIWKARPILARQRREKEERERQAKIVTAKKRFEDAAKALQKATQG